jgi:hypothetical protein
MLPRSNASAKQGAPCSLVPSSLRRREHDAPCFQRLSEAGSVILPRSPRRWTEGAFRSLVR